MERVPATKTALARKKTAGSTGKPRKILVGRV